MGGRNVALVVEMRNTCNILIGILKQTDYLAEVDLDGCIIVKWILSRLYGDWNRVSRRNIH
jgi:hypothetical protein